MKDRCKNTGCYNDAATKRGLCLDCDRETQREEGVRNYTAAPPLPDVELVAPHALLGLELEVEARSSYSQSDLARCSEFVCSDGSLQNGGEIKLVGACCEIPFQAADVTERAKACGAIVSQRCGFHVHIDIRNVHAQLLHDAYLWLKQTEDWWFALVPPTRQQNQHCRRIDGGNLLASINNHYSWVNVTHKGTLEVRIHPGTCNPHKVIGWSFAMAQLGHALRARTCKWNASSSLWECTPALPKDPLKLFEGHAKDYVLARMRGNGILKYEDGKRATEA